MNKFHMSYSRDEPELMSPVDPEGRVILIIHTKDSHKGRVFTEGLSVFPHNILKTDAVRITKT